MEKILKDKNYMEISGDEMPMAEPEKTSIIYLLSLILLFKNKAKKNLYFLHHSKFNKKLIK